MPSSSDTGASARATRRVSARVEAVADTSGRSSRLAHPKVTGQLVCVCAAECSPILIQPLEEGDLSERGPMRGQQPSGQTANLIGREDDVAYDKAEHAR